MWIQSGPVRLMSKPRPAGSMVSRVLLEGNIKLALLWERVRPGKEQLYRIQLMLVEPRGGVSFSDNPG